MRDGSSTGTVDDAALLAGSKKLDDLRNALEGNKETAQIDAMKKVIGYIAKGKHRKNNGIPSSVSLEFPAFVAL